MGVQLGRTYSGLLLVCNHLFSFVYPSSLRLRFAALRSLCEFHMHTHTYCRLLLDVWHAGPLFCTCCSVWYTFGPKRHPFKTSSRRRLASSESTTAACWCFFFRKSIARLPDSTCLYAVCFADKVRYADRGRREELLSVA